MTADAAEWKKTACILCSVNCGIEVQLHFQDVETNEVSAVYPVPICAADSMSQSI